MTRSHPWVVSSLIIIVPRDSRLETRTWATQRRIDRAAAAAAETHPPNLIFNSALLFSRPCWRRVFLFTLIPSSAVLCHSHRLQSLPQPVRSSPSRAAILPAWFLRPTHLLSSPTLSRSRSLSRSLSYSTPPLLRFPCCSSSYSLPRSLCRDSQLTSLVSSLFLPLSASLHRHR